jgi:protein phosphatase
MDGYEYFASGHLITVFSATNYCGRDKNCGALLELVDINDILLVTPKQIEPFLDAVTLWPDQSKTRPPSPMRAPRTATPPTTKTHKKPGFNHFTL